MPLYFRLLLPLILILNSCNDLNTEKSTALKEVNKLLNRQAGTLDIRNRAPEKCWSVQESLSTYSKPKNEIKVRQILSKSWDGGSVEYCTSNSLNPSTAFKARISGLVTEGKYQEAIWLLNDKRDPSFTEESKTLLEKLNHIFLEGTPTVVKKTLAGTQTEKSLLSFDTGILGIFKPTLSTEPWGDEKSEVAAYNLDQVLQFDIVPFTIVRKFNNREGSLQYYFNDVEAGEIEHAAASNFGKLKVFDYITGNTDRKLDNFLYWREQDRIIGIDHGLALREGQECGKPEEISTILESFPKLKESINCVDDHLIEQALSPLAHKPKVIHSIIARIHSLRTHCGRIPSSVNPKTRLNTGLNVNT